MTKKIRLLERIRVSRGRLRDAAAIIAASADARARAQEQKRDGAACALGHSYDQAPRRLTEAGRISELIAYDQELREMKQVVAQAEVRSAEARSEAERACTALRSRERELRTTEKVLDRVRAELAAKVNREEQKLNDDLSAARMRKIA